MGLVKKQGTMFKRLNYHKTSYRLHVNQSHNLLKATQLPRVEPKFI